MPMMLHVHMTFLVIFILSTNCLMYGLNHGEKKNSTNYDFSSPLCFIICIIVTVEFATC